MASFVSEDLSGYIVQKINWMVEMQRDIYSMTKVETIFFPIGYSYCIQKGKFVYSKARVLFFYDALPKTGTEEKCQILKLE